MRKSIISSVLGGAGSAVFLSAGVTLAALATSDDFGGAARAYAAPEQEDYASYTRASLDSGEESSQISDLELTMFIEAEAEIAAIGDAARRNNVAPDAVARFTNETIEAHGLSPQRYDQIVRALRYDPHLANRVAQIQVESAAAVS